MKQDSNFVTNNKRTRYLPKIILGQTVFSLIVILLAFGLAFYAQGYRFDFRHFSVVKTGVLVLTYQPNNAIVSLNNASVPASDGNLAINLQPGNYNISISDSNYASWNYFLKVNSESVNLFDKIVLFFANPKVSSLTDQGKISLLNNPTDALALKNSTSSSSLYFNNYEIWAGGKLVTRLSTPIQDAIWYPDFQHVIYQQGKEIRVIETSGRYDTLLATMSSDKQTELAVNSHGDELYFQDSSNYEMAKIR